MSEDLPESLLPAALELSRKTFPNQPPGFPITEDFDWNAVRLPADIRKQLHEESDEEDAEALADLTEESGFESVIVVDHLPIVAPEKIEKLTSVIKKIFSSVGSVREGGFCMPFDESTDKTKGYCFMEFEDPDTAVAAKEQGHNYRLDKNHTFAVCMFDDFDRYQKVPEEYVPLEVPPYLPKEQLYSYMLDKRGLDQFVIRYKDETEVCWWDGKKSQSVNVYKKSKMTESFVQWSPHGTYLMTAHRQGMAMWGGPKFERYQRFAHPGVRFMDFSPNEMFLLTYSLIRDREGLPIVCLKVFNVRTGTLLRTFQGPPQEFIVGKGGTEPTPSELVWPLMKWAGGCDDKYFAKLGTSKNQAAVISVYETPDMVLLDKKSLKLEAVQAFEWSPSDPIMCIYQRESGNLPARISLIKIPERKELRQKNLFNVKGRTTHSMTELQVSVCLEVFIHWHPQGDYVAVRVNRHTRTKKTTYYGFELFRIREKDIPMEVLELPKKTDEIIAFAWEPHGTRFVVAHGNGPVKYSITFYSMVKDKGKAEVTALGTLEGKIVNQVYWSPKGQTVVFVGPVPAGMLEFFNVDLFETMGTGDHYLMTDLVWDPSGRYVCTFVAHQDTDNGYHIWTFQGRNLIKELQDHFFQFSWRPRRPSLLSAETRRKIESELKTYSKKYDAEDEILLMAADTEIIESRNRQMHAWKLWITANASFAEELDQFMCEAYGAESYAEAAFEMKTVELQQTVDVKEENYKPSFGL